MISVLFQSREAGWPLECYLDTRRRQYVSSRYAPSRLPGGWSSGSGQTLRRSGQFLSATQYVRASSSRAEVLSEASAPPHAVEEMRLRPVEPNAGKALSAARPPYERGKKPFLRGCEHSVNVLVLPEARAGEGTIQRRVSCWSIVSGLSAPSTGLMECSFCAVGRVSRRLQHEGTP